MSAADHLSIDRLIHEPARPIIVATLYAAKRADSLYMLPETGLTKGNLSAHLSQLEQTGYAEGENRFHCKTLQTALPLSEAGSEADLGYRQQLQRVITGFPEHQV